MGNGMKFTESPLEGSYIIEPEPFIDGRGLFYRMFCKKEFEQIGFKKEIVQINHSLTRQVGAIRGMHYQIPPVSEIKIIRCIKGAVYDVIIDIRTHSPTFRMWYGIEISKKNMKMVFIPEGFAHGFQVIDGPAELIYHHTEFYSPSHERGLRFDDPLLAINWPLNVTVVSEKDRNYSLINNNFIGVKI